MERVLRRMCCNGLDEAFREWSTRTSLSLLSMLSLRAHVDGISLFLYRYFLMYDLAVRSVLQ